MNKVNKILKYILYTLMIISLVFTIKNKVNAQTTSYSWGTSVISTSTASSLEISRNSNFMQSLGEGKIIFNFSLQGNATIYNVVAVTYNNGTATNWQCDFGSLTSYYTNNETVQTATAICPIGYTGNQGLRKIFVSFRSNGSGVSLGLGDYFTFSNADITNTDYTNLLNTINTNINNLGTKMNSVYSKLNDINTNMVNKFNDILTKIETNNTTLNTTIQQQTQQQHQDSQNTQNKIDNIDNTIKDDTVDNNQANSFFNDFQTADTGSLMDIVGLPLEFLDSLYDTCQPFTITIPFIDNTITIPCMSTIYNDIGSIIDVVKILINGFICYYILKRFIEFIQELKDPNNDDIEVMDL